MSLNYMPNSKLWLHCKNLCAGSQVKCNFIYLFLHKKSHVIKHVMELLNECATDRLIVNFLDKLLLMSFRSIL
jgi:hypothetical protein